MFFVVIGFLLALIAHYKIFRIQIACVKMFDVIEERFKSVQSTDVQISNEVVNETLQELYKFSPDELSSLYNKVDVHVTDQQAMWKACFSESKEERALHMQYCLVSKPKESVLIRRAIASHLAQKQFQTTVVPPVVPLPEQEVTTIHTTTIHTAPKDLKKSSKLDDAAEDDLKIVTKKTKKKKETEIQIE